MPSSSKKQHNFMMAIAKSPAFAKKVGIPQSVGSDFERADKGRKFAKGGETMATKDKMQDKAMIKRAFKQHDMQEHKGGKGTELKLKNGGMTKRKFAMGGDAGNYTAPERTSEMSMRPTPVPGARPTPSMGPLPKYMVEPEMPSNYKTPVRTPEMPPSRPPGYKPGGASPMPSYPMPVRMPKEPTKYKPYESSTEPEMRTPVERPQKGVTPMPGPKLPPPNATMPMPKGKGGPADKMGPRLPPPVAMPVPKGRPRATDDVPTPPPARARQIMDKIAANRPFKAGGSVGSASTRGDGIAQKGKTQAMQVKMASGGYTVPPNGINKMASGGMVNSASRRADGIAQKGKTKAMQIKMMNGGKC